MAKIIVRSPFGYDADAVSDMTGLMCLDPTMANQAEKEECDINTLVKRFGLTGTIPQLEKLPLQMEYVAAMTYQESLNAIIEADASFMELPADLRSRWNHDPGQFVDFCSKEENRAELIKMGLIAAPPPPAPPVEPLLVRVMPEKPA